MCKLDMEVKLVSGSPYRKPKDRLWSYYITMQIEQREGFYV